MDKTPKLTRKSLSLTTRLRSKSSASPGSRLGISLNSSSPISNDYGLDCTPPNRKYAFNSPYSPSKDMDFSPRSLLSQSSTNSPDVTWRWTQNDPMTENSSPTSGLVQSTPNSSAEKEQRIKRSVQRKEELRKLEMEKRKAIKTRRDIVLKQKYEEMELLISKRTSVDVPAKPAKQKESTPPAKERSISNSSGYGSNCNIDHVVDLLNDSESDNLLIQASQNFETKIEECAKNADESLANDEQHSVCEFLQDSLDDWFASLDADLLAAQPKKPRTSLQRFKSMPTESPTAGEKSTKPTIKRYTSSNALPPNNSPICRLLKKKLNENRTKAESGQFGSFDRRPRGS